MADVQPSDLPPGGDPLVGTLVDGRYTIEKPLASGGMGSVYLARQKNLARPVAVKVVTNADADLIERFRREAEALAEVSHPAIVEVHDFVAAEAGDGRCYLVMSYVEGENLEDFLARLPGGRVEAAEAIALLMPIASALVQLHAGGIVHRDIKPANIIRFQGADGRPAVKLVDFGIARRAVDTSLTSAGYIIGTPPYMAPETLMAKPHTPVADVYAVGATLYEMLTGDPPHGRGALHEIMARALQGEVSFPPPIRETALGVLLGQMLHRSEERRPNILQVLDGLERIRDELTAARLAQDSAPRVALATPDRQAATVQLPKKAGPQGASQPAVALSSPGGHPGALGGAGLARTGMSGPHEHTLGPATAPTTLAPGLSSPGSAVPGGGAAVTRQPVGAFSGVHGPGSGASGASLPGTVMTGVQRPGGTGGTAAFTASSRAPSSVGRGIPWVWLGPILALPVVIAVVAIAMLAGKGKGESDRKERSSGGAAMLQAEGARPTAQGGRGPAAVPVEASRRGAPARDPVEARASGADAPKARPSEESVWSAAKVGELVATCKSPKDARRLYDQATRLRGSKRSVDRREAIALYQAVLQCGHSDSGKRRYSAYGLSLIFRGMGDCVSSRSHWETHREMSQRANLRHERMPACR